MKECSMDIIKSLSPNERKIMPFLEKNNFKDLHVHSGLDETSALRALEFLSNKKIVDLKKDKKHIVELGVNGVLYKQKGLPERRLINLISDKGKISLKEAERESGLNSNEFQVSLGSLKKKALIDLVSGEIVFKATKEEITKKTLEEKFIEQLPLELNSLSAEQKYALESLKHRKQIIEVTSKNIITFSLTKSGKELLNSNLKFDEDLIEVLTPEIIQKEKWRGKEFRTYDIQSHVPKIFGGKRHFVNQATEYAKSIWLELGFKEMSGLMVQSGFWNFDALFTAQDHPVREIQDTFYIRGEAILPEKKIVKAVKDAHEGRVSGSKGWNSEWREDDAKKIVLRTHTTVLSAHTLSYLGNLKNIKDKTGKFFAVGKCFRNETVDWSHGFEFNQTEGIVIDKNANFRNLLGYLKEFYLKMGFADIKFVPSYFPYTEPSVEIYAYNSLNKVWIEVGGAGIFRPEVVIPLLGEYIPVLAWGPGFDRMIMNNYGIKDLREMYSNDITKLREMKFWSK
jgi:phenylalanyl-tRNA synthetase alpha chain